MDSIILNLRHIVLLCLFFLLIYFHGKEGRKEKHAQFFCSKRGTGDIRTTNCYLNSDSPYCVKHDECSQDFSGKILKALLHQNPSGPGYKLGCYSDAFPPHILNRDEFYLTVDHTLHESEPEDTRVTLCVK